MIRSMPPLPWDPLLNRSSTHPSIPFHHSIASLTLERSDVMNTRTHCDFLRTQVQEARRLGARILCGGHSTTDSAGKGRFFAPTVVADATHNMSIMTEESFGPVVGIAPVVCLSSHLSSLSLSLSLSLFVY